jgi:hypothetical protein
MDFIKLTFSLPFVHAYNSQANASHMQVRHVRLTSSGGWEYLTLAGVIAESISKDISN